MVSLLMFRCFDSQGKICSPGKEPGWDVENAMQGFEDDARMEIAIDILSSLISTLAKKRREAFAQNDMKEAASYEGKHENPRPKRVERRNYSAVWLERVYHITACLRRVDCGRSPHVWGFDRSVPIPARDA